MSTARIPVSLEHVLGGAIGLMVVGGIGFVLFSEQVKSAAFTKWDEVPSIASTLAPSSEQSGTTTTQVFGFQVPSVSLPSAPSVHMPQLKEVSVIQPDPCNEGAITNYWSGADNQFHCSYKVWE